MSGKTKYFVYFDFRRDRVSLKTLSLERKLELLAGDEEFLEAYLLANPATLRAVTQKNRDVAAVVAQANEQH